MTPVSAIARIVSSRTPPRSLGGDAARDQRHGLAQRRRVHVVEQQVRGSRGERGRDLGERVDLDDDPRDPRGRGAAHRLLDRSGDRDVIVLDHRRIPQPHAVVLRAAHARGVFLEEAQAGDGLARVEQDRAGAGDAVDIGARQRGDAREMLDGVERRTLGGEQGARLAGKAHQVGAGGDAVALRHQRLDRGIGIERDEKGLGDPQPGDGDRVAAVHHARKARVRRDHRGRGYVARRAEILGERGGDESVEVETGERENHARL